ncbi:hypothetical protein [Shewanella sp. SM96]|uniref:hypothetical protein n=1 Tax=Shewanella TaxID=22 RepID=UPI0021DB3F40|nr:hypothetical protein [Shewanella sp. SM96]MCU8005409.1 hypothetical protein [Shewanella sp. SM96]
MYSAAHQLYSSTPDYEQYPEPPAPAPQGSERYKGAFREFTSLKCHGTKAAIELKPSISRKGWETVMLEGASAIGPKTFNWGNKSSIQITKSELPHVISTLLGIKPLFEMKSHGAEKNKGATLKWQTQGNVTTLFVNIYEGGKPAIAVPIGGFEAMMLGHMALAQYLQNFPTLTADACIRSLEIMARHNI